MCLYRVTQRVHRQDTRACAYTCALRVYKSIYTYLAGNLAPRHVARPLGGLSFSSIRSKFGSADHARRRRLSFIAEPHTGISRPSRRDPTELFNTSPARAGDLDNRVLCDRPNFLFVGKCVNELRDAVIWQKLLFSNLRTEYEKVYRFKCYPRYNFIRHCATMIR